MTDVYQGLRASSATRPVSPQAARERAETRFHRQLAETAGQRRSSAWSGSLCEADMALLMTVIEQQVLPRLVREYRPSDGLPLKRCIG